MIKDRLLIIVSNDYGELGMSLNFTAGLEEWFEVRFLVCKNHYEKNQYCLPTNSYSYSSGEEIIEITKDYLPTGVLFFSAFLLVPNGIFSLKQFSIFIDFVHTHCKYIATSDPFLGSTGRIKPSNIGLLPGNSIDLLNIKKILQTYFACFLLRKLDKILADAHKIIPLMEKQTEDQRQHCFFNSIAFINTNIDIDLWTFVISKIDLEQQKALFGYPRFLELLSNLLNMATFLGKKPTLIAPETLIKDLQQHKNTARLLNEMDINSFHQIILNSGKVFYWNMISNSIYERFIRQMPVYFFDKGHVKKIFPKVYELAIKHYYAGEEPMTLDMTKELDIAVLEDMTITFYAKRRALLNALKLYPAPVILIDQFERTPKKQISE